MTRCELRITSGARAGHREVFDKTYIGLGRHPLSDVRFDAEKDLDASTRHAAIVKNGESYVLRDLGSTNGTFVNGDKLAGDRPLRDGDVLKFGVHGPEVTFHVLRDEEEVVMPAVQVPPRKASTPTKAETPLSAAAASADDKDEATGAGITVPPQPPPVAKKPRPGQAGHPDERTAPMTSKPAPPSKTSVLRAEVGAQKSRARALLVTLVIVLLGALGVVYWQGRTSNQAITGALHTVDSLTNQVAQLQRLRQAADSERTVLLGQIRQASDPSVQRQLQTRLVTIERRSAALQQAEAVDYAGIQRQNMAAVAVIYVRFPDTTQMWEGTAFSVNAQGLMITNRHLVRNNAGQEPRDIAIRFSGSPDVHPARLVRAAPDADLALIQLESAGPFPAISGMDPALSAAGAPVALIGFPGGSGGTDNPRAKLVTGSVTMANDSTLELDAFSGTGASGSPIFNRDGKVVGVLYGGRGGASSTEIVGLPIRRAMALMGN